MPINPLTAVQLALSGAQLIGGLMKKEKKLPKPRVSSATDASLKSAQQYSNATQAAGAGVATERALQAAANRVGQAKMAFSDPNKVAQAAQDAQSQANKAMRQIDAAGERQQIRGQEQRIAAEARMGREQQEVRREKERQAIESNNIKQSRIGQGIGNALNVARDAYMMGKYAELNADPAISQPEVSKSASKIGSVPKSKAKEKFTGSKYNPEHLHDLFNRLDSDNLFMR
ncbi:MAG: hypothetical protein R3345_13295 [Fulvivirga sp.]|nr:hypothetical protein [Fulvivirga sp.]